MKFGVLFPWKLFCLILSPVDPLLWIVNVDGFKSHIMLGLSTLFLLIFFYECDLSESGWRPGVGIGKYFFGGKMRYWEDCRISLDVGWPIYAINMGKSSFEYPQIQRLMHSRFDEAAAYIYRHYNGTRMEGSAARFLEKEYVAWIRKHGETWGPLPADLLSMRVKQKMLQ